jgi:hypothetical protein
MEWMNIVRQTRTAFRAVAPPQLQSPSFISKGVA